VVKVGNVVVVLAIEQPEGALGSAALLLGLAKIGPEDVVLVLGQAMEPTATLVRRQVRREVVEHEGTKPDGDDPRRHSPSPRKIASAAAYRSRS
jgi:hypothetical protein